MFDVSRLYLPGVLALWSALLLSLLSLWGYSRVLRGAEDGVRFARSAYGGFALAVGLAALALGFALVTRDFRLEYVYRYSSLELPARYQLAAFWAGQRGSFLIWLLWGSLLGLPLARTAGRQEPAVMIVYTLTLVGLLLVLVSESPFRMLATTPADGRGLNPLLETSWMVIHPPIMFIGYAASAIPFSFAMAALWRRDYEGWAARAFPWALTGFLVLGLAIVLGGRWAYETLGWGGYWGWDPVENASLIPFLLGTVLVHGLYLERARGLFRRSSFVLAALVYLSVVYGTFLTRSGVLAHVSVHSFVDLGSSGWLLTLMAVFGGGALVLLALRLPGVSTRSDPGPLVSRGPVLGLSLLALLISTLGITVGTSAPLVTSWLGNPAQVAAEFYDRMNLPIALLLALLLAVVPFLGWRGTPARELGRRLLPSAGAALGITIAAAVVAVRDPLHLAYVFLAALALGANLHKLILDAAPGRRAPAGSARAPRPGLLRALLRGVLGAGGYLSHVGFAVLLIGLLASSAYQRTTRATLELGRPQRVDGLELTFLGPREEAGRPDLGKEAMALRVERPDGARFEVHPERSRAPKTGRVTWRPDVVSGLLADLYVSPQGYSPEERPPTLAVEVIDKPLILLVWLGFVAILAGGLLATVQRFRQAPRLERGAPPG
jgi:cytochrome c-type biogenesis protein CcmF